MSAVEFRAVAAVDDVGIERIGRDVVVLFGADGVPIAEGDGAIVAAAGDGDGAALLLSAVDPIGRLVIGDDVIELRGGLVVPTAPGAAVVDGDGGALIGGEEDDVGVQGIDPDGVVVVAAGGAFDGGEGLAGVVGAVGGGVGDVDDVLVFGVYADAGEIAAAAVDALLTIGAFPGGAGIVGAVDAAGFAAGLDEGVHAIGFAGRDGDADASEAALGEGGKAVGEGVPGGAAVGGFEEAAVGAGEGAVLPGCLLRLPEDGVDGLGIARVEGEVDGAGAFVLVEHLLPGLAAIGGAKDAALGVGAVGVAEYGDEEAVGVARIDEDGGDLPGVAESEVAPGFAGVGGLVHAVADGEIGALEAFAGAYVDGVGVGGGEGDGADGAGGLVVEEGLPGAAEIIGLPDAAVVDADVEDVGLGGDAGGADGAAATVGSDIAPAKAGIVGGGLGGEAEGRAGLAEWVHEAWLQKHSTEGDSFQF